MRFATRAAAVATLALVLVAGLGAPSAVADAAAASPVRLQLRTPVAEAVLGEAHAALLLQPLFDSPPGLEVLVAFSQPIVRGADDYVTVLWVRPVAGAEAWSGVWWADSSIGATPPRKVTIYEEGLFLVLEGGARATSDRVHVTYTFVGQDGRAWTHAMPAVPVLDALPDARTVALSGAAASSHGHADIPEVVIFTPWNLLGRPAEMGFTITDADGGALHEVRIGACATGSGNLTESGCRVPFIADQEDAAAITTWSVGRGGARLLHETHAVADLVAAPHLFGSRPLADEPTLQGGLWLDARVAIAP